MKKFIITITLILFSFNANAASISLGTQKGKETFQTRSCVYDTVLNVVGCSSTSKSTEVNKPILIVEQNVKLQDKTSLDLGVKLRVDRATFRANIRQSFDYIEVYAGVNAYSFNGIGYQLGLETKLNDVFSLFLETAKEQKATRSDYTFSASREQNTTNIGLKFNF